ncbi:hypothetical protein P9112_003561 [Eukaryota sp. TZLM1-RC]
MKIEIYHSAVLEFNARVVVTLFKAMVPLPVLVNSPANLKPKVAPRVGYFVKGDTDVILSKFEPVFNDKYTNRMFPSTWTPIYPSTSYHDIMEFNDILVLEVFSSHNANNGSLLKACNTTKKPIVFFSKSFPTHDSYFMKNTPVKMINSRVPAAPFTPTSDHPILCFTKFARNTRNADTPLFKAKNSSIVVEHMDEHRFGDLIVYRPAIRSSITLLNSYPVIFVNAIPFLAHDPTSLPKILAGCVKYLLK